MTSASVDSRTVIIGASAAGLAVAACLQRAGKPFVILEAADRVGGAWRGHYDRLHLHTSKRFSALPHLAFPSTVPRYPSRDDVVAYLEAYAAGLTTPPRFGQRAASIEQATSDGALPWITTTQDTTYRSRHVVVATGFTRAPHEPSWPGLDGFGGQVMHSAAFKNGVAFAGKRVLVVGLGNSGGEIALELAERGARPILSVRSPVHVVPREFFGLSNVAWSIVLSALPTPLADAIASLVSRAAFGSMKRMGLQTPSYGPITQVRRFGRIPLIDVGTVARIRSGDIEVLGDVESFSGGSARFRDGVERPFDAVVLATGYRPALGPLLAPLAAQVARVLDDEGRPRKDSGALPGLYFCGFHVAPTGMLREIGREARRVADAIACDTEG